MPEPDREAYEAAERLVREAQAKAERSIPPNGWSSGPPPPQQPPLPDLNALLALVDSLRGQLPPELARQLADALRELLVALRAVLDHAIERLEPPPAPEREVQDIPIR